MPHRAGAFPLSDFDAINPANRTLSFTLPLVTVKGRGTVRVPLSLRLGVQWTPRAWAVCVETQQPLGCVRWEMRYAMSASWWNEGTPFASRYLPALVKLRQSGDNRYEIITGNGYRLGSSNGVTNSTITATLGDGRELELRDAGTSGKEKWPPAGTPGFARGTVFPAVDGSGATFVSNTAVVDRVVEPAGGAVDANGTLYLKDGTRMEVTGGRPRVVVDRNGNRTSMTYDENGRLLAVYALEPPAGQTNPQADVSIAYGPSSTGNCGVDTIQYVGAQGNARTMTVTRRNLSEAGMLRSGFSIQNPVQLFPKLPSPSGSDQWALSTALFNPCLPAEVKLPNNRSYKFRFCARIRRGAELTRFRPQGRFGYTAQFERHGLDEDFGVAGVSGLA